MLFKKERKEVNLSTEEINYDVQKRDIHLLLFLLSLVLLSVLVATSGQIISSRQRALNDVETHNRNLAQALDTYTEGVITQSSMILVDLAERLELEGASPSHLQRLQQLVNSQKHLLNQLHELVIVDATGQWVMSSRGINLNRRNTADRNYFLIHRNNPSRDIFIGPPIRSNSTGEWILTVSRRFDKKNGKFAGVIIATLNIETFLNLFGKIEIGKQGAIALTTTSGQLLIRYPFIENILGHDFSGSKNFVRYYSGLQSGTASFASSIDGTERIYSFRKNHRYPIITTVALGKYEALSTWHRQMLLIAVLVFSLMLAISVIGWRLIRAIKSRAHAELSLIAAREKLIEANLRLEQLATHDQLTGLANRRRFDELLEIEVRRSVREKTPLSLLLIDLDYFKGFNDNYGHVAGDECLKAVSRELVNFAKRPGVLAARYGGEEMGIILQNTSLENAMYVAQQLIKQVKSLGIAHCASPLKCVTVSIGVATFQNENFRNPLQLVEAADAALYRAKALGRNCAEFYENHQ